MAAALSLILAEAASHDATVLAKTGRSADIALRLHLVDGRTLERHLRISVGPGGIDVGEPAPRDLPAFCPGRHINEGGSFCLGWGANETKPVADRDDAIRWWGRLIQFLRLQVRADRLRRWPDRREWAHGHAANHQAKAEMAAARLGPRFVAALERGRLTLGAPVNRRSVNGPAIALLLDGVPVTRVWRDHLRPVNMRQPCICDARRDKRAVAMKGCKDHAGTHADAAVALVRAMTAWQAAEAAFWRHFKSRTCCGTLDDCPLKKTEKAGPDTPVAGDTQERIAA